MSTHAARRSSSAGESRKEYGVQERESRQAIRFFLSELSWKVEDASRARSEYLSLSLSLSFCSSLSPSHRKKLPSALLLITKEKKKSNSNSSHLSAPGTPGAIRSSRRRPPRPRRIDTLPGFPPFHAFHQLPLFLHRDLFPRDPEDLSSSACKTGYSASLLATFSRRTSRRCLFPWPTR